MKLQIQKMHPDAIVPQYALADDAGLDIASVEDMVIEVGQRGVVSTGLAMAIPRGYVGLVWDKSGRAVKDGLKTMAGVIDSGYRGEIKIVLLNTTSEECRIAKGEKIAQILLQEVLQADIEEVDALEESERGERGFGSTGLSM